LCLQADNSWLRADEETVKYETGKSFIFDDTYRHEVKNDGDLDRIILLVDVYHPDLTVEDKKEISKYFAS
jgi:aspartyl/asparaginyl beta-hydroxylase (cupin superfamily)